MFRQPSTPFTHPTCHRRRTHGTGWGIPPLHVCPTSPNVCRDHSKVGVVCFPRLNHQTPHLTFLHTAKVEKRRGEGKERKEGRKERGGLVTSSACFPPSYRTASTLTFSRCVVSRRICWKRSRVAAGRGIEREDRSREGRMAEEEREARRGRKNTILTCYR